MGDMENADARLNVAVSNAATALSMEAAARADWARLTLLALAEKHPGVTGFTFETDWEYDDEGGYFPTVSIFYDGAENEDEMLLDDDLNELAHNLDPAAVHLLGDRRSIEELKEVRF